MESELRMTCLLSVLHRHAAATSGPVQVVGNPTAVAEAPVAKATVVDATTVVEACNSLGSSPKFQLLLNVTLIILFILLGVWGIFVTYVKNLEGRDFGDFYWTDEAISFYVTALDLAYWFGLIVPGRLCGTLSLRCWVWGPERKLQTPAKGFLRFFGVFSRFQFRVKHFRIEGSTSPTTGILGNYGTFVLRSPCCG